MHLKAETAWATLATAVAIYEITADDNQLLSHAVDRWLTTHPWTTRTIIATTALHLANLLPTTVDPWHHLTRLRRNHGLV